jgi:hypothetical protein
VKRSTLPAVRVEPELRSDAEAFLDEGGSLPDFIASLDTDMTEWAWLGAGARAVRNTVVKFYISPISPAPHVMFSQASA